ncbi:MAG: hypothetical protein B7733_05000 [Myxococcales bacterium FL481]|nr:MAG: hypothetical protein B7733_05000 [Myxococcales bacterium FL481]
MNEPPNVDVLRELVAKVGRRERVADAVGQLHRIAFPAGLLLLAASVVGIRATSLSPWWAMASVLPVVGVIAWASGRPRDWRGDARRLDAHYGLHDQIGNALEFAAEPKPVDPATAAWMQAAVASACEASTDLDARPVVRLNLPRVNLRDFASGLALALAFLVPMPAPRTEPAPTAPPPLVESQADERPAPVRLPFSAPLRRDLGALSTGEGDVALVASNMLGVLAKLERGELDRTAALERLAELEQQLLAAEAAFEASVDEDPALLAEAVRQVAEAFTEHATTERAGEALARLGGEEATERLDEAFADSEADAAAAKAMDRALTDAERRLAAARRGAEDTRAQLEQAERRLRREENQQAEDQAAQERRLKRQRDRLDALRRQHEREQAAARELERLRRLARNARSSTKGNRSPSKRRQAQRDLSRGLGDAARKARQARRLSSGRDAMEQAKTLVRRAGQQNDNNRRRDRQRQRFARAAKGKKKGERGEPTMFIEGDVGDDDRGDPSVLLEEDSSAPPGGEGESLGDGDLESERASSVPSHGIGEGSDNRLGDATGKQFRARDHQATPHEGRGATRAEVIADASQQGFATEAYRRVYTDYRAFAQSAIDDETLPAAKRRQVRRYFQMIQPRDENP